MPRRVRRKSGWPSSRSRPCRRAVSVGWVTKRASAARLTLTRRATSKKPSTWTSSIGVVYRVRRRTKNRLWRAASLGRDRRLLQPHRTGEDEEHGQRGHRCADVQRRHQADAAAKDTAQEGSDRDRAPDDRPDRCVEPALKPDGDDRLAQADLVDVVDAAGEG